MWLQGSPGVTLDKPTYNGNHSGHYEAVEIGYDPAKISYAELLEYYWVNIGPFDAQGQCFDKGSSYLSAIFVASEAERQLTEQSRKANVAQFPGKEVVTPILDTSTF